MLKSKVVSYFIKKQGYETNSGAQLVRFKTEDGVIHEEGRFACWHFQRSEQFINAEIVSRGSY